MEGVALRKQTYESARSPGFESALARPGKAAEVIRAQPRDERPRLACLLDATLGRVQPLVVEVAIPDDAGGVPDELRDLLQADTGVVAEGAAGAAEAVTNRDVVAKDRLNAAYEREWLSAVR